MAGSEGFVSETESVDSIPVYTSLPSLEKRASRVLDILKETFDLSEVKKSVFFRLQFLKDVFTKVDFINF